MTVEINGEIYSYYTTITSSERYRLGQTFCPLIDILFERLTAVATSCERCRRSPSRQIQAQIW